MPIVTTYVCDRCKASQDTEDQMWHVAIQRAHYGSDRYHNVDKPYPPVLWCRPCCEATHVLGPLILFANWVEPPAITMEDLIRQIIKDEQESQG